MVNLTAECGKITQQKLVCVHEAMFISIETQGDRSIYLSVKYWIIVWGWVANMRENFLSCYWSSQIIWVLYFFFLLNIATFL